MRSRIVAALLALIILPIAESAPATGAEWRYEYARMSDGVDIALAISFPEGFNPDDPGDTRTWPTVLIMDGYAGANSRTAAAAFDDRYVAIKASIRGTGCSGGRYDLFDRRHALDGKEIIDRWLQDQPWATGDAAIWGHSYSGLTGFLIASTGPKNLRAVGVSGLIADTYRDIVYPGGIANTGFPLLWHGYQRSNSEISGSADEYVTHPASGDTRCTTNVATRPPRDMFDDLAVQAATSPEDDSFWHARSLITYASTVRAPIHITQQYQEEQTGRRAGPVLFEAIREDVPKRLVLTNGVHGTHVISDPDRLAWFDCFIIDAGSNCTGDIADPEHRVRMHFETTGHRNGPNTFNPAYTSSDFPLPETVWRRLYLIDGALSPVPPVGTSAGDSYLSTPWGRQMSEGTSVGGMPWDAALHPVGASSGPDEVSYAITFDEATAIAGPIALTLFASSTAPDVDFFASLIEVDPEGNHRFIQRGMLRASHGALDDLASDRIGSGPHAGEIYRPYHPHTNTGPVTPGEVRRYDIEIFPLGHVMREGHTLVLKVHAPPYQDRWWMYASGRSPSVVTIMRDAGHPSSLLLPTLPGLPPITATRPSCDALTGIRCHSPLLDD